MISVRWPLAAALLALSLAIAFVPAPAAGADVDVILIAASLQFHVGTPTAPSAPTITIAPGDTLRLRVENQEATFPIHTFTAPHFQIDQFLQNGSATSPFVVFVTITTTSTDAGKWQFWCRPHSSGADPENHVGMIGWIDVRAPPPPRTPGFEWVTALAAIAATFALLGLKRLRRP